jgi:hypothetical protein
VAEPLAMAMAIGPNVDPGSYCVVRVIFGPRRISRWEALPDLPGARELWPGESARILEPAARRISRAAAQRLASRFMAAYRRERA